MIEYLETMMDSDELHLLETEPAFQLSLEAFVEEHE